MTKNEVEERHVLFQQKDKKTYNELTRSRAARYLEYRIQ